MPFRATQDGVGAILRAMLVRKVGARVVRVFATGLVLTAALSGCARQPRVRAIVGPDGTDMLHVSCGSDQGACFQLAGRRCSAGYELTPIFDPSNNNFLVRCRDRRHLVVPSELAAEVPARRTVFRATDRGTSSWPPPLQPWPDVDPWPAADAGSGASELPQTARLPNGEIDIGY